MTTALAASYRKKIEGELKQFCSTILSLLTDQLIPKTKEGGAEAKVTYYKAQGDYHRYIAEIEDDVEKTRRTVAAKKAYEEGTKIAEASLAVTNHFRLGL